MITVLKNRCTQWKIKLKLYSTYITEKARYVGLFSFAGISADASFIGAFLVLRLPKFFTMLLLPVLFDDASFTALISLPPVLQLARKLKTAAHPGREPLTGR